MKKIYLLSKGSIKRLITTLTLSFIFITLILVKPQITFAAYGGRIGGSNFNSPSTSSRANGYGENYRGYGRYGGAYRAGGGIGFPFIMPIFGFGGGLFGFLILMTISGVIANAFRNNNGFEVKEDSSSHKKLSAQSVSMIQMQIGLLAGAKEIQKDLEELAHVSDTSTSRGLQNILQETTLSLLRKKEFWVYANLETGNVPFHSADSTFNRISINERSKLEGESISNFQGRKTSLSTSQTTSSEMNEINEFIIVTILISLRRTLSVKESINNEFLQENLKALGAIPSSELLALEIIWQPEEEGGTLSKEELVTNYPNLKHL
tara:strand:+ start:2386 stop:3348 length:963 start_codon:yes stop_codon:yes gene_type:complete